MSTKVTARGCRCFIGEGDLCFPPLAPKGAKGPADTRGPSYVKVRLLRDRNCGKTASGHSVTRGDSVGGKGESGTWGWSLWRRMPCGVRGRARIGPLRLRAGSAPASSHGVDADGDDAGAAPRRRASARAVRRSSPRRHSLRLRPSPLLRRRRRRPRRPGRPRRRRRLGVDRRRSGARREACGARDGDADDLDLRTRSSFNLRPPPRLPLRRRLPRRPRCAARSVVGPAGDVDRPGSR